MDLRLFSIDQLPRTIPLWDDIIEDLGRPPADSVARALQVGRSTVYRWNARGHAPRTAALALFWLTRWGRSAVHTQATNDAILAVQLARALSEERLTLRDQVAALDAANRALRFQAATNTRAAIDAAPPLASADADVQRAEHALRWPELVHTLPNWPALPDLHPHDHPAAFDLLEKRQAHDTTDAAPRAGTALVRHGNEQPQPGRAANRSSTPAWTPASHTEAGRHRSAGKSEMDGLSMGLRPIPQDRANAPGADDE